MVVIGATTNTTFKSTLSLPLQRSTSRALLIRASLIANNYRPPFHNKTPCLISSTAITSRHLNPASNRLTCPHLVQTQRTSTNSHRPFGNHLTTAAMSTRRSARLSAVAKVMPSQENMPPQATKSHKRRASSDAAPSERGAKVEQEDAPSTPKKRRTKAKAAALPPATPTPSNAKLIGEAVTKGTKTLKPRPAAVNRLASPKATNATLLSPETSRIVASKSLDAVSPSKAAAVKTTTDNILHEACAHLIKVDVRMKPLIDSNHCRIFSAEGLAEKVDPFESLCSGIISQQVSGAAAKAIKKRFVDLFEDGGNFPHPSQVAVTSIDKLRTAGLSQRKAEYVQGLAEKFVSGELSAQFLHDAPYEEVLEKLIAVRGLGKWSVEMFACFGLKRMDVFSLGDLGVQRGMAAFVGRDVSKLKSKGGKWKYMSETEMEEMADKFAPYRSVFMWYMWRVEETDISTLE